MAVSPSFPHRPILNRHDSAHRFVDSSAFSQSIASFFPHAYHSFRDSSIALQSYHHNVYNPRASYMGLRSTALSGVDSPLRSLLPLDLLAALKRRIHSQHTLNREVKEEEEPRNAVVIHSSHGLFVLSRLTGGGLCSIALCVAFLTDIPLPPHKV